MSRNKQKGNCYAASEALFYILGGKQAEWTPQVARIRGGTHWFLKHSSGMIIDPSKKQFNKIFPYKRGTGCGFLTGKPSRRARELIELLTWK